MGRRKKTSLPRMPDVIYLYVGKYSGVHVPYIYNPEVHGIFYGLDLKKEMVVLEKQTLEVA